MDCVSWCSGPGPGPDRSSGQKLGLQRRVEPLNHRKVYSSGHIWPSAADAVKQILIGRRPQQRSASEVRSGRFHLQSSGSGSAGRFCSRQLRFWKVVFANAKL